MTRVSKGSAVGMSPESPLKPRALPIYSTGPAIWPLPMATVGQSLNNAILAHLPPAPQAALPSMRNL